MNVIQDSQRKYAAWIGGSMYASLATYNLLKVHALLPSAVVTPIASRALTTYIIRYLAPSTLTQRRLCTSGGSRTN